MDLIRKKQFRLLMFHEKLGHTSFSILKLMAKCGILPRDLANIDPPVCPGCAYGKMHRKPTRYKGIRNIKKIRSATAPGHCVSVDQLVSPTPGFVPIHRGKPTTQRYKGATIFVDHYSDLTYCHLMTDMNAEATVAAKEAFERLAGSYNVLIKHYHCDNGLFDTVAFKASIIQANQTISFCGVNAHHQNGRAERRIRDVTEGARTALLHASHRWPKAIHPALWSCALKHYVNLRNNLPSTFIPGVKNEQKRLPDTYINSPFSKFSGFETEINIRNFHPFGSPVYVLEDNLQSQKAHNKWSDRSRVGIFLQHSPLHSSSVPLVLNTTTGLVSPQFHCLYDDDFATCKLDAKFNSAWQQKAQLELNSKVKNSQIVSTTTSKIPILSPAIIPGNSSPPDTSQLPVKFRHQWENTPKDHTEDITNKKSESTSTNTKENTDSTTISSPQVTSVSESVPAHQTEVTTRTGRTIKPPTKFADTDHSSIHSYLSTFYLGSDKAQEHLLQPNISSSVEPHPFALFSEYMLSFLATDPDTMTLQEAMQQPDKDQFLHAMKKELEDHISRKHWKVVPAKCIPKHKRSIPMVWSMKRKRNPVGEIIK